MNLFFNPRQSELFKLLSKATNGKPVHEVVVDFDGEVLVDPEIERPNLDTYRFKMRFMLSDRLVKLLHEHSSHLNSLFIKMQNAWNDKYNIIYYTAFDIELPAN
jgi:hypothetical protein